MLSVLLIWIYMFATTFVAGYGVLRVITRHIVYHCEKKGAAGGRLWSADVYLVCGFVCVTVYAQFFSLFAGVGLLANLLLCAVCGLIVWFDRRVFFETAKRLILNDIVYTAEPHGNVPAGGSRAGNAKPGRTENGVGDSRCRFGKVCVLAVLILLFSYGTSRGIIHYDTSLYHAQSIRWVEEYGVVKGLGNLHCRLAYNSASFAVSALYSFAFLGGQSYHCAAGWLALVLAAVCLRIGKSLRVGRLRTSDFARVMCVYYLVNIFDEMISPASDYFMVLLAFYIVIKWLELSESGEQTILPYALLCVLGVFLMTVKLSAAFILLLTVYPACRLIREKRWRETGVYLGLGVLTALPFFIRNVVISGWLVYPFTQLDFFDVVWKVPKGLADYDAREIQVWGRGYTDVGRFDAPVREWLPGWFRTLSGSDKVFVLAAAAAAVILIVSVLMRRSHPFSSEALQNVGHAASKKTLPGGSRINPALLTAQATVAASFLFWLCTSPLMRYGCVWVYLTPAVVFGGIYEMVMRPASCGGSEQSKAREGTEGDSGEQESGGRSAGMESEARSGCGEAADLCGQGAGPQKESPGNLGGLRRLVSRAACGAVVLLLLYKGFALAREIAGSFVNDYWLVQKDYENYETRTYEIEGVTFYCPTQGDQAGYEAFPSSPAEARLLFLGDGLADGFRAAE